LNPTKSKIDDRILKSLPVVSIEQVVERQLCVGCGICAHVEPLRFRMGDAYEHGRRPFLKEDSSETTNEALAVCPGASLKHLFLESDPRLNSELRGAWGPVYEVWEGYASDDQIRLAGSSGGAATALSLYCLEQLGMSGVLHTDSRKDVRYLNETVLSKTREELLARTGSRYAPASPCDSLHLLEQRPTPGVFIGKPCDVAAVQRARRTRPQLDSKLGLTIAFFCAGTPSTQGTVELMKLAGVADPDSIESLRYRGNGWPGMWTVEWIDSSGSRRMSQMTYAESWGFLQKYRQWRCYVCPDHTGEFADIAVGDPWYREVEPGEAGKSLIVVRTELGKKILEGAASQGYITLETMDPMLLPRSQPNLLSTRGGLWGRLWVLRLLGGAVPRFTGFPLFRFWLGLSAAQKLQSFTGTAKRVFSKKLRSSVAQSESTQPKSGLN
jgi:coenzyme F420 hydrogenase subunit beta